MPTTSLNLTLDDVSALPLLKDAAGLEWLTGRCRMKLALAGQGISERQIIESLNGNIEMAVAGGAIVGIDLSSVVRNLEEGRITGWEPVPGARTQFSEFAGTLAVTNGMAQNHDLRIASPHVRVTGAGSINLTQQVIDYTVRPAR
jgi:AsmA protein